MTDADLRELAVRVIAGTSVGSGFFVAPGQVLTCAHVVRGANSVKVVWKEHTYDAELQRMQPESWEPGATVLPDIALLGIAANRHPSADLDARCNPTDQLYAWGYPVGKPAGDSLQGRCEGPDGRGLIKFADTVVDLGMSGSPVLNLATGKVCGMVKATRDNLLKNLPIGGLAVPGSVIQGFLAPRPDDSDVLQGLPGRPAAQIDAFLLQYLGTPEKPAPFGGRQNDLQALDEWLASDSPQYGLIEARGGLGKSALLAHWIERLRGRNAGYSLVYFPISARRQTNSETALFESLSFRLATLFGETVPRIEKLEDLRGVVAKYLDRAANESRRLLLVIDGLDEAAGWEAGTELFPPRRHGSVRILVAARPFGEGVRGWLGRLGWNTYGVAREFHLDPLDLEAVADVLRQMGDPLAPLAGRMNVVSLLAEKSRGDPLLVGLYVNKLRDQVHNPETFDVRRLQQIEPGLNGFFEYWFQDQVQLWGEDRYEREPGVRALLALCSLAHGRLTPEDVQRLAPETFDTRRDVEKAAHDLRRLVIGDAREGYTFDHPRLGVFVREEKLEDRERSKYEQRFLSYGRQAIDDFQSGRRTRTPDYLVRWYSTHLWDSGRPCAEYGPLLTASWCSEWERVDGTPAGFVVDLDKAWERASAASDLGVRIRVSLLRSSVLDRGRGISLELFTECVSEGLINPTLAEVIALQQAGPEAICSYLLVIARGAERERLLEAALSAVGQIWDDSRRHDALTAVVEQLRPADGKLLQQARAAARHIRDKTTQSQALQEVAEKLPPDQMEKGLEEALAAARDIRDDPGNRAWRIGALSDRLPLRRKELFAEVLSLARETGNSDGTTQANILNNALRWLRPDERDLLNEWLDIARRMQNEIWREHVLKRRLKDSSEDDRELVREVLVVARGMQSERHRVGLLTAVSEKQNPGDRTNVLVEALKYARGIPDAETRDRAMSDILTRLTPADTTLLRDVSTSLAEREGDPELRAWLYTKLAERSQSADRERTLAGALAAASRIGKPSGRASALISVAEQQDLHDREKTLQEALAMVPGLTSLEDRVKVWIAVAALVSRDREKMLAEALDTAYQLRGWERHRLSDVLEQFTSSDRALLRRVFAGAHQIGNEMERARFLCEVLERISVGDLELLRQARDVAGRIWHRASRVKVLTALAARVDPADRQKALEDALAAARRIGDEPERALALSAVAEKLPPGEREKALAQAIAAVREIGDDETCARSLSTVLEKLHPEDRELVQAAAQIACRVGDNEARALALSTLADKLAPDERRKTLRDALAAACLVAESPRGWSIAAVAERLHEDDTELAEDFLAAARQISIEYSLARALCSVAERFPSRRQELFREALSTVRPWHESALDIVAGRLGPDDRELLHQVLMEASRLRIKDLGDRRNLLYELVPRIAPEDMELLHEALAVARQIDSKWSQLEALCIVAGRLAQREREEILAEVLAAARSGQGLTKAEALGRVAVRLAPSEQQSVLEEALALIHEAENEEPKTHTLEDIVRELRPGQQRLLDLVRAEVAYLVDPRARAELLGAIVCKSDIRNIAGFADSLLPVLKYSRWGILETVSGQWREFCRFRNTAPADELGLWLMHLNGAGRSHLIRALTSLLPAIEMVGGQPAIAGMVQAIVDSGSWWP